MPRAHRSSRPARPAGLAREACRLNDDGRVARRPLAFGPVRGRRDHAALLVNRGARRRPGRDVHSLVVAVHGPGQAGPGARRVSRLGLSEGAAMARELPSGSSLCAMAASLWKPGARRRRRRAGCRVVVSAHAPRVTASAASRVRRSGCGKTRRGAPLALVEPGKRPP